jgi:hypothetical protein
VAVSREAGRHVYKEGKYGIHGVGSVGGLSKVQGCANGEVPGAYSGPE